MRTTKTIEDLCIDIGKRTLKKGESVAIVYENQVEELLDHVPKVLPTSTKEFVDEKGDTHLVTPKYRAIYREFTTEEAERISKKTLSVIFLRKNLKEEIMLRCRKMKLFVENKVDNVLVLKDGMIARRTLF